MDQKDSVKVIENLTEICKDGERDTKTQRSTQSAPI